MSQKRILMLIAQHDFRDEEYEIPKEVFAQSGFEVKTASERRGEAKGKIDAITHVDFSFHEINIHDYDVLVFIGGTGISHYFHDEELLTLAREGFAEGKIIAAICYAPTVLANAGILQGKRVTAHEDQHETLVQKGAQYTGMSVEVDGNIITANGPKAAHEFAEKIVEMLSAK